MVKLVHEYLSELRSAFKLDDLAKVDAIFSERPDLKMRRDILGGTWLYEAATSYSLDVLSYLVGIGFEVNSTAEQEGDTPLCSAASSGRYDNAVYLLEHGAALDTSLSVRNPLFAAIVGGSLKIIELILKQGIDASVEYKSPTMNRINAASFALLNEQPELMEAIVSHQAEGDEAKYAKLLDEVEKAVKRQEDASPYKEWIEVKS